MYNRVGDFLFQMGGEGGGPGELRLPTGAYWIGEGLIAVPDLQNARTTVFDEEGKFQNIIPMQVRELRGDLPIEVGKGQFVRRSGVGPIGVGPVNVPDREALADYSLPLLEIVNADNEVKRTMGRRRQAHDPIVESFLNSMSIAVAKEEIAVVFRALNEIRIYTKESGDLKRIVTRPIAFTPQVPHRDNTGRISADVVSMDASYDPDGRLWILTPLYSTQSLNSIDWTEDLLSELMALEVYDEGGHLLSRIPLPRPFDALTFDPQGDLWLLDARYKAEVVQYKVVWP